MIKVGPEQEEAGAGVELICVSGDWPSCPLEIPHTDGIPLGKLSLAVLLWRQVSPPPDGSGSGETLQGRLR